MSDKMDLMTIIDADFTPKYKYDLSDTYYQYPLHSIPNKNSKFTCFLPKRLEIDTLFKPIWVDLKVSLSLPSNFKVILWPTDNAVTEFGIISPTGITMFDGGSDPITLGMLILPVFFATANKNYTIIPECTEFAYMSFINNLDTNIILNFGNING